MALVRFKCFQEKSLIHQNSRAMSTYWQKTFMTNSILARIVNAVKHSSSWAVLQCQMVNIGSEAIVRGIASWQSRICGL